MTAVTLWAVLTQMPVVLVMTYAALLRHFHSPWRLRMAGGTLQFGVRTKQREMRLLGVIKHPQRPTIG
jgi:hypothetical protein